MSDTRNKIIDTMYKLLAQKGYDKTSIGQIAEEISIKKPSIYYYFKNKEEILLEMIDKFYTPNLGNDLLQLKSIEDTIEYKNYLFNYGYNFIDYYQNDLELRKVCAEVNIQSNRIEAVNQKFFECDKKYEDTVKYIFEHGIKINAFKKDFNLEIAKQMFIVYIQGLDNAIVYGMGIDCKAVWKKFIENYFI